MSRLNEALPLGGILAGGQSRRFGSDKAVARVGDRSMVVRAVETLRAASDPVVLLGGDGTVARRLALPWRPDEQPGKGPLAGIATGLRWAEELGRDGLLVLACDLPLVTTEAVRALAAEARADLDAVVAAADEPPGTQPLCGWYATRVLSAVEDALARGSLAVMSLLEGLRVERVDVSDVGVNVNTPADLERAARLAAAEHGS